MHRSMQATPTAGQVLFEDDHSGCGALHVQAAGALSTSISGELLLVGSADGCVMLQPCRLDPGSPRTSHPVLHDMWAGEPPPLPPLLQYVWMMIALDLVDAYFFTRPASMNDDAIQHVGR